VTYERSRLEYGTAKNAGVGDRTDGAFMAGELGVLRVDVNRLGKAGERDQQNASQRKEPETSVLS
jgi:hypothetical protein